MLSGQSTDSSQDFSLQHCPFIHRLPNSALLSMGKQCCTLTSVILMHRLALLQQGCGEQRVHTYCCIIRHDAFAPASVMNFPSGPSRCLWVVSPVAPIDPEGRCWLAREWHLHWMFGDGLGWARVQELLPPQHGQCKTSPLLLLIAGVPPRVCACTDQQQHPQPRCYSLAQPNTSSKSKVGHKFKHFTKPRPTRP